MDLVDEWARNAAAGDRQALEALLRALLPEVRRKVRRYVGRRDDVDDVCQQVLIAISKGIRRFRGDANVRSWVHTIAVRTSYAHLRNRKQILVFDPDREPRDERSPVERLQARDTLRQLEQVLDALSAERRMVFVLADVEGHTAPEISQRLQIPLGTVYGRLRDARRIINEALRHSDDRRAG